MGAGRMAVNWFSGALLSEHGYQPRHRSTRRGGNNVDDSTLSWLDNSPEPGDEQAYANSCMEPPEFDADHSAHDALDQMTFSEIRRVLEGCALDDPTTVVPELVQLIAHSSHTPETLAWAWSEFEEATRDVYALRLRMRDWSALVRRDELDGNAVALMLSYADDAWQLITRGPSRASAAVAHIR